MSSSYLLFISGPDSDETKYRTGIAESQHTMTPLTQGKEMRTKINILTLYYHKWSIRTTYVVYVIICLNRVKDCVHLPVIYNLFYILILRNSTDYIGQLIVIT